MDNIIGMYKHNCFPYSVDLFTTCSSDGCSEGNVDLILYRRRVFESDNVIFYSSAQNARTRISQQVIIIANWNPAMYAHKRYIVIILYICPSDILFMKIHEIKTFIARSLELVHSFNTERLLRANSILWFIILRRRITVSHGTRVYIIISYDS